MELPSLRFVLQIFSVSFLAVFPAYYFAVINVAAGVYEDFINDTFTHHYGRTLSASEQTTVFAFVVTSYNIGGLFGSLSISFFAERWGRKNSLMLINSVLVIISAVLMAGAKAAGAFSMLVIGRVISGYSTSLGYGVLVLYLSEVGPTRFRGFSSSTLNLMLSLNTLITLVLALPICLGTSELWIPLQGLPLPFAVIQLLVSRFFPETPKFLLLKKQDRKAAKAAYSFFDPTASRKEVREAFKHFAREEEKGERELGLVETLKARHIRNPLLISLLCQIAAVTTGIVVIFSYSTGLFQKVGFSKQEAQYYSLLMSAFNTLGAVVANFLMDKVGRRPLMLWGLGLTATADLAFMILSIVQEHTTAHWPSSLSIAVIIFHVTVFNIGPGAVGWFISAEMTPQNARSLTTALCVTGGGVSQVVTNFAFPPIQDLIGPYVFLTLAIPTALFTLILFFYLPETKQRPVDEIVARWRKVNPEIAHIS